MCSTHLAKEQHQFKLLLQSDLLSGRHSAVKVQTTHLQAVEDFQTSTELLSHIVTVASNIVPRTHPAMSAGFVAVASVQQARATHRSSEVPTAIMLASGLLSSSGVHRKQVNHPNDQSRDPHAFLYHPWGAFVVCSLRQSLHQGTCFSAGTATEAPSAGGQDAEEDRHDGMPLVRRPPRVTSNNAAPLVVPVSYQLLLGSCCLCSDLVQGIGMQCDHAADLTPGDTLLEKRHCEAWRPVHNMAQSNTCLRQRHTYCITV